MISKYLIGLGFIILITLPSVAISETYTVDYVYGDFDYQYTWTQVNKQSFSDGSPTDYYFNRTVIVNFPAVYPTINGTVIDENGYLRFTHDNFIEVKVATTSQYSDHWSYGNNTVNSTYFGDSGFSWLSFFYLYPLSAGNLSLSDILKGYYSYYEVTFDKNHVYVTEYLNFVRVHIDGLGSHTYYYIHKDTGLLYKYQYTFSLPSTTITETILIDLDFDDADLTQRTSHSSSISETQSISTKSDITFPTRTPTYGPTRELPNSLVSFTIGLFAVVAVVHRIRKK